MKVSFRLAMLSITFIPDHNDQSCLCPISNKSLRRGVPVRCRTELLGSRAKDYPAIEDDFAVRAWWFLGIPCRGVK
jgi:hypothetical protein